MLPRLLLQMVSVAVRFMGKPDLVPIRFTLRNAPINPIGLMRKSISLLDSSLLEKNSITQRNLAYRSASHLICQYWLHERQLHCNQYIFTARLRMHTYVLVSTSVCLSVRPSVCLSDACIVTKRNTHLSVYRYHMSTIHRCFYHVGQKKQHQIIFLITLSNLAQFW